MTAAEAKEFFKTLAQQNGIDASSLLQALDNEGFAKEIANGFTRHSEYSQALDKARALEQKYQTDIGGWQKWYQEYANPTVAKAAEAQKKLEAYIAAYGEMPDGTPVAQNQARSAVAGLSKEEIADMLKREFQVRDQAYATMSKQLTRLAARHLKDFNEDLDIDQVEKLMDEKHLPLEAAYREYVSPRMEERAKVERKDWETKRSAEIERDIRSRFKVPVDAKPRESVSDIVNPKKPAEGVSEEKAARDAFLDAWSDQNDNAA